MSVRIKVRMNGSASGAALKILPGSTSKEQLIGDSLAKLDADRVGDVDMHRAKIYLVGGDTVSSELLKALDDTALTSCTGVTSWGSAPQYVVRPVAVRRCRSRRLCAYQLPGGDRRARAGRRSVPCAHRVAVQGQAEPLFQLRTGTPSNANISPTISLRLSPRLSLRLSL